jgi:hypothetical protein
VDWKQECEREIHSEKAFACLPPDDVVHLLLEMMENTMEAASGPEGWDMLSPKKWEVHCSDALCRLCITIREEQFVSLSSEEKEAADFFVRWAGCCMHKELNTAKGRNAKMRAWWEQNGIDGPVLLMNKDNAAATLGGSSAAKE